MITDYSHLHSRYNPEAEALRFINSLELKSDIEVFILIEPGEGYMIPVLKEKFPQSIIIPLHIEDNAELILNKELNNKSLNSTPKIIEWRPALNYYKTQYVELLSKTVKYIKRFEAETRTTEAFGKRWIKNFLKNTNNINTALLFKKTDIPVIITGSGPSLEQAIPKIKIEQDSCLIIATSSSVIALNHYGIKPDMTITTDGGNWALKHLITGSREQEKERIEKKLALNLCAAIPSQYFEIPQLILNDGSLWQNIILKEFNIPSVIIPQRGTVTASAIELALQLTNGNIYHAGLDLKTEDIKTHVSPYAFENFLMENTNRFTPFYSQCFKRAFLMIGGGSMEIYADWFKEQYKKWPNRIKSIKEFNELAQVKKRECIFNSVFIRNNKKAEHILINALKNKDYSNQLKNELFSLLGKEPEEFLYSFESVSMRGN